MATSLFESSRLILAPAAAGLYWFLVLWHQRFTAATSHKLAVMLKLTHLLQGEGEVLLIYNPTCPQLFQTTRESLPLSQMEFG